MVRIAIPRISSGIAITRTTETLPADTTQRTSPTAAIIGARSPMRRAIDRNVWIIVTSVVFRVISEDVPNLSRSAAEKLSTLWKISFLSSPQKPVVIDAVMPAEILFSTQESTASPIMTNPRRMIRPTLFPLTPSLIMKLTSSGIIICEIVASSVNSTTDMTCFRFSLTLEKIAIIQLFPSSSNMLTTVTSFLPSFPVPDNCLRQAQHKAGASVTGQGWIRLTVSRNLSMPGTSGAPSSIPVSPSRTSLFFPW